jgi:hypothetical protein
MCVKQRTNWTSCKLRALVGCSAPFVIVLKSSITNRVTKNFSFCKKKTKRKTRFNSLSTVHSSNYWIKFYSSNRSVISQRLLTYIFLSHYHELWYPIYHYECFSQFAFWWHIIVFSSLTVSTNFFTWSYFCSYSNFTPIFQHILKCGLTHALVRQYGACCYNVLYSLVKFFS